MIRQAKREDLSRIAEIFIFNNRINYFPIFHSMEYSYKVLTAENVINKIVAEGLLHQHYVYEDNGIILGFTQVLDKEIIKLYVDPLFQGKRIGEALIEYNNRFFDSNYLWALEKNTKARKFYNRHGFFETGEKKYEEGTSEYIFKLVRASK